MKIALAGNPNSGKTTLYNALTGKQEHVGNWSGVTISKKEAKLKNSFKKDAIITDLPGAYSIKPFTSEESITVDFIKGEKPDVIINVVDTNNLARSLFFTTQVIEIGIPVVVALNKTDIQRNKIDIKLLEKKLKVKVVQISANKNEGLEKLIDTAMSRVGQMQESSVISINNNEKISKQDKSRFEQVNKLVAQIEVKGSKDKLTYSERADKYITNPIIGIILFVAIMSVIFDLSINTLGAYIADTLVAYIETFQGFVADSLANAGTNDFLVALLSDGIIGGVGAIVGFLPLIMVLMFLLALLEDSGFMARIAVIFDPLFKKIGLSGKSIIPMIVGYGCSIPGVMASRTIKDEKQRRMTALLTPFVPCGAKVPIIALFTAAFFPTQGYLFPLVYLIAFFVIIGVGLLLKSILGVHNIKNYFIIELPEYSIPSFKRAFFKMIEVGKDFIIRAGTIIVLCNTLVFVISSFDFSLQLVENMDHSILAKIATPVAYLLIPLGIGTWQLAAAAVTGFIAKEEVVGTLSVVYAMGAAINSDFELLDAAMVQDTMGITATAAFSFMLFNLFTPPCFAAMGAMRSEIKSRSILTKGILLQIGVGYVISMVFYQVGTLIFEGHLADGFIAAVIILGLCSVFVYKTLKSNKEEEVLKNSHA